MISFLSQTIISHQEEINTSVKEKVKKIGSLLVRAIFSFGCGPKMWRDFTNIFATKKEKKYFVVTQVRPRLGAVIHKNDVQRMLNARGIPLNCAKPARQLQLNDVLYDNVQTYLTYLRIHGPQQGLGLFEVSHEYIEALFQRGIKKITIGELERNLAACATYVQTLLTKPYDIGFQPQKSSKWIAELALTYLSHLPEAYFYHAVDSDSTVTQSPLTTKTKTYVIFDDCSYTGHQLRRVVVKMGEELARLNKKGKLFLVVPFISSCAVQQINYAMQELQEINSKLKVHLITSDQRIKMISDFDPSCQNRQSITFTEWKIPDGLTLDSRVSHAKIRDETLSLLTDFPPCYKKREFVISS